MFLVVTEVDCREQEGVSNGFRAAASFCPKKETRVALNQIETIGSHFIDPDWTG